MHLKSDSDLLVLARMLRRTPDAGLFLNPIDSENAAKSLDRPLSLTQASQALPTGEAAEKLRSKYNSIEEVYCWGTRERNRTVFSRMSKGDLVLFSKPQSGEFGLMARIVVTLEAPGFSTRVWTGHAARDHHFLYFLEPPIPARIDKTRLLVMLGYSKTDRLQRLRQVSPDRLRTFFAVVDKLTRKNS